MVEKSDEWVIEVNDKPWVVVTETWFIEDLEEATKIEDEIESSGQKIPSMTPRPLADCISSLKVNRDVEEWHSYRFFNVRTGRRLVGLLLQIGSEERIP